MRDYVYVLRVTRKEQSPRIQSGHIHCENFHVAVKLLSDTDHLPWEDKTAKREIISLQEVTA